MASGMASAARMLLVVLATLMEISKIGNGMVKEPSKIVSLEIFGLENGSII